jgi:hypothetical protein
LQTINEAKTATKIRESDSIITPSPRVTVPIFPRRVDQSDYSYRKIIPHPIKKRAVPTGIRPGPGIFGSPET